MFEEPELHENETLDDLILGGMRIIQGNPGYRFSLDAVLLAHFPEVGSVRHIYDLGAGNGVVSLLLAKRAPRSHIWALDIQTTMIQRARRNVHLNRLDGRIEIIQQDISKLDGGLWPQADLVVSNPPFFKRGEGKISQNEEEAIARHELKVDLDTVVAQGARLLRASGTIALIQRAQRLVETAQAFQRHGLNLQKLRMVHPAADRPARMVLMEGGKNGARPLQILPPLIVYQSPGVYSTEIRNLYTQ